VAGAILVVLTVAPFVTVDNRDSAQPSDATADSPSIVVPEIVEHPFRDDLAQTAPVFRTEEGVMTILPRAVPRSVPQIELQFQQRFSNGSKAAFSINDVRLKDLSNGRCFTFGGDDDPHRANSSCGLA